MKSVLAAVLIATLIPFYAHAQSKPDFSGTWKMDPSRSESAAQKEPIGPVTIVIAQTENSKATVKTSLQNVRDGLDKLELDFRTTPGLERYYPGLAGVAAEAATAEEQAAQNQFDKAARTLLGVVNHLTDALLEMH